MTRVFPALGVTAALSLLSSSSPPFVSCMGQCPTSSPMQLTLEQLQSRNLLTLSLNYNAPTTDSAAITLEPNQRVVLELGSSGSIGYTWKWSDESRSTLLTQMTAASLLLPSSAPASQVTDVHAVGCMTAEPNCGGRPCVGAPSYEYWLFQAPPTLPISQIASSYHLTLEYNFRGATQQLQLRFAVTTPKPNPGVPTTLPEATAPPPNTPAMDTTAAAAAAEGCILPMCTAAAATTPAPAAATTSVAADADTTNNPGIGGLGGNGGSNSCVTSCQWITAFNQADDTNPPSSSSSFNNAIVIVVAVVAVSLIFGLLILLLRSWRRSSSDRRLDLLGGITHKRMRDGSSRNLNDTSGQNSPNNTTDRRVGDFA